MGRTPEGRAMSIPKFSDAELTGTCQSIVDKYADTKTKNEYEAWKLEEMGVEDARQQHRATQNDFERKGLTAFRKTAIEWNKGYAKQFNKKDKLVYIDRYKGVEELQIDHRLVKLKFD